MPKGDQHLKLGFANAHFDLKLRLKCTTQIGVCG